MTINLTRIYTRLGDGGQTHLGDMSRVSKCDARVEAYGTVDELNSFIGLTRIQPELPERFQEWLGRIQNDLLDLGADLCLPERDDGPPAVDQGDRQQGAAEQPTSESQASASRRTSGPRASEPLATAAAQPVSERQSPEPLPTGNAPRARLRVGPEYVQWLEQACDEVNSQLAPLRSFVIPGGSAAAAHLHVCRTICRRAERRAIAIGEGAGGEAVRYLNRLSDLLFILARAANEAPEHLWRPGSHAAEG